MDYTITAKRIIKGIANPVLDFCGVYDALLDRRVFSQPGWLILMYHRVVASPADDPFQLGMCVEEKHFAEQIEYQAQTFTPITVGEGVARINAGKPLPSNAISITFDDGYLDFKTNALPILKRFHCPSTIFVTTGGLEQRRAFWWDRVIDAVARTNHRAVDITALAPRAHASELSLAPHRQRRSLVMLQQLLWQQPPERIEACVDELREQLGVQGDGPLQAPRMDHADIAAIARDGVELGAHCEQHIDMRRLSTEQCLHELTAPRVLLEELTGRPVTGFAYPGGRQNTQVEKLVARAGFTYAASTQCGINRQPYDMYRLRRLGAPDSGVADYKRCLGSAAGISQLPMKYESVPWP